MSKRRSRLLVALVALSSCAWHGVAHAEHHRDGWVAGLGFGPNRGVLDAKGSDDRAWATGSAPQLRIGRFFGERFAVGIENQGWFTEVGTAGEDFELQVKLRVSAQIWAFTATYFPFPHESRISGLYVVGGAGPTITNFALAIPDPEEEETGAELQARLDAWGWGAFASVGYEIPVTRTFASGLQLTLNRITNDDEDFFRVWFGGLELHLAWYF